MFSNFFSRFYNKSGSFILLTIVVFFASSIVSYGVWLYQKGKSDIFFRQQFQELVGIIQKQVDQDINALNIMSIAFSEGKNASSPLLFEHISDEVRKKHVSIKAIEWVPIVKPFRRFSFESSLGEDDQFVSITEIDSQGNRVKAKERSVYYPIELVSPSNLRGKIKGFDLGSRSFTKKAIEKALETNQVVSSPPILFSKSGSSRFIVFIPLKDVANPGSMLGVISATFDLEKVVDTALSGVDVSKIQLNLFADTQLLYPTTSTKEEYKERNARDILLGSLSGQAFLEFAGQKWLVKGSSPIENFNVSMRMSAYLAFIAAALLFSLILFIVKNRMDKKAQMEDAFLSAAKEVMKAKEQARDLSLSKSNFLAHISHEVRTPMDGVMGMTQLLLDTDLDLRQRDYANTIMRSTESLLGIVNDIFDLSKIENGDSELDETPCDLRNIIEDVIQGIAVKAREKHLDLYIDYHPDLPRHVIIDGACFRQVMLNLIGNAIKFTHQGYVLVQVSVSPGDMEDTQVFQVSVIDTGIGMSQEHITGMFEKFSEENIDVLRRYGGTGLGLALTQGLVNLMNGTLHAESNEGKGASFTVTLPMCENTDYHMNPPRRSILEDVSILIVDSNSHARTMMSDMLGSFGMEVLEASSVEDASKTLRARNLSGTRVDLAIIDSNLEDLSSAAFKSEIAESCTSIILVSLSAASSHNALVQELGCSAWLLKPITLDMLRSNLTGLWAARKKGQVKKVRATDSSRKENRFSSHLSFNGVKALIVEDNVVNQRVIEGMLSNLGVGCTLASNGKEAVDLFKEKHFSVVFMDCRMPEMDGFEATLYIREFERKHKKERTPIVALTASAMKGDREGCLQAGMDDYISKPVKAELFQAVLFRWCKKAMNEATEVDSSKEPSKRFLELATLDLSIIQQLKEVMGDSLDELVEKFEQDAHDLLRCMETAYDNKELEEVMFSAHSLKSSSAQLGATQLSKITGEIESLAQGGSWDHIGCLIEDAKMSYSSVQGLLKQHIQA